MLFDFSSTSWLFFGFFILIWGSSLVIKLFFTTFSSYKCSPETNNLFCENWFQQSFENTLFYNWFLLNESVSMYFGILYPLILFKIKLIFWKNHSFLRHGFYMKHNQNKIFFLISYDSSSFDDMNFLAYGVSRNYVTSAKMTPSPFQNFKNFDTPFKFDLYGIEKTYANFDALVIIWKLLISTAYWSC